MLQRASNAAKRLAYVFLSAAVFFRECWLRCKQTVHVTWNSCLASSPQIEAVLRRCTSSFRDRRPRRQKGTVPRTPTVLGVVVVQSTFGQHDDQALCRLLAWAQLKGFQQVFLYDPAGEIQGRQEELMGSLKWVDPGKKIQIWSGWRQPQFLSTESSSTGRGISTGPTMGVALLSAADAEEPLLNASHTEPAIDTTKDRLLLEKTTSEAEEEQGSAKSVLPSRLEAAIAAPSDLKSRLTAAAGPLAGIEPDLVVVFGSAFTLAGFPPWAVRTAEVFEVGALGAVTSGKMDAVLRRYLGTRQRFGK